MSAFDDVQNACVVRYPYLWAPDAGKGETGAANTDLSPSV